MIVTTIHDPETQHRNAVQRVPAKKLTTPPDPEAQEHGDFVRYVGPSILALCLVAFAVLSPGLAFIALLCLLMFAPCVVLHEFAHLLTARWAKMQVLEFSLGFGKRLWSRQWRGITWSVKMLPLGGSVEIAGMTVEDVERNNLSPRHAFIYKSPIARMWVVLSGILTNALLAWIALTVAVIMAAPSEYTTMWSYVTAPLQGLYMLGVLLQLGATSLGNAIVNWTDPNVGSILSLPQSVATGIGESLEQGIPIMAYFVLAFAALNISLALFNALPLFPLDGYHGATATVDQIRRIIARIRRIQFAPLSTWQLRWFTRSTGTALALFVGTVFVRDIIKMM